MEDSGKPKTVFTTRKGLYQFRIMPFGLCNTGATFERLMKSILQNNWAWAVQERLEETHEFVRENMR
jgi:hypothetical protein